MNSEICSTFKFCDESHATVLCLPSIDDPYRRSNQGEYERRVTAVARQSETSGKHEVTRERAQGRHTLIIALLRCEFLGELQDRLAQSVPRKVRKRRDDRMKYPSDPTWSFWVWAAGNGPVKEKNITMISQHAE